MDRNAEALVAAQTDMPVSWSMVIPSSMPSAMAILAAGRPRRTAPPAIGPNDILFGSTSALPEPSRSRYVRWIAVTSVPDHRITAATIASGETYVLGLDGLPSGALVYRDATEGGIDHGLYGAIVIYGDDEPRVDHDIIVFEDEFAPPVTDGDDFFAVLNGKAYPLNPHYIFAVDEVVRFRMVNIGSEHHTFHIHGHVWLDERGNNNDNEVLAPGEAVDGLVQMREPGSWMYHCHIYDHIAGGMTSMLTVLPAGFEGDPVAFCRYGGAQ